MPEPAIQNVDAEFRSDLEPSVEELRARGFSRPPKSGVIGRLRSSSIGWFKTASRRGSLRDGGLLRYKGLPG
jgi:hypothetical protein